MTTPAARKPPQPTVEGEWVDPSIPLPDNAIRQTRWWAIVNRLPRPILFWITNIGLAHAIVFGPVFTGTYPPVGYLSALFVWSAGLYGITTYEKRLGIA